MSNNTVTWAQLTPGQQAYLDTLARAGGEWVGVHFFLQGIQPVEYHSLKDAGLFESRLLDTGVQERITAAGLAVWQQGQVASAPRSVWVAMWWQYGEDTLGASYIVAVCESQLSARIACENVHKTSRLKWSDNELRGYDGIRGGYYEISEMSVLP